MRKISIMLVVLLFVAALAVYGKAFAQKGTGDVQESVEALEADETGIVDSSPVPGPESDLEEEIEDERDVDEDA